MGRDINFRAWHKWEKKMYEVQSLDFFWGIADLQWWTPSENGELHHTKIAQFVDSETSYKDVEIMQYTGLKDKNGVEIYEGDVIKSTSYNTWLKVEFDKGQYGGKFVAHGSACNGCGVTTISCLDMGFYEVIGNIYQNPELLGGNK